MGEEPRLTPNRETDNRPYVSPTTREKALRNGNGELPWYAISRVNLQALIFIGTLLISLGVAYSKVQAHDLEIANIKATMQTKEAAASDQKLILQRLNDLERNVTDKIADVKEDLKDMRKRR